MEDLGQQPSCNQGLRMTTDQFCRFDRPTFVFFSLFSFFILSCRIYFIFFFFLRIYT